MSPTMLNIVWALTGGAVALAAGFAIRAAMMRGKLKDARHDASLVLDEARTEADEVLKDAATEAEELRESSRKAFEAETHDARMRLSEREKNVARKGRDLEKRVAYLDHREQNLSTKGKSLDERESSLETEEASVAELRTSVETNLERVAGLSAAAAKAELVASMEKAAEEEATGLTHRILEEAKGRAREEAKRCVVQAIRRIAPREVIEDTVSVIKLPSDEMKGRIIGREGRNIRALEMATGVDILVDETPSVIVASCFDPIRRAVAKETIERLVEDGRIHPARAEEMVEKVVAEFDEVLMSDGEAVVLALGLHEMHPKLVRLIGRMKHQLDVGQNLLEHSKEVAQIAGRMAAELELNAEVAIRAGLLHDIAKADESAPVGTLSIDHAIELLTRYGESPDVIHAVGAQHSETAAASVEAILVEAADRASMSRPGGQDLLLNSFVERLAGMEETAMAHEGVARAHAIKAGKEMRVIVESDRIKDQEAIRLSRTIANQLVEKANFPGQIRVSVIREIRAVDYAM